MPDQILDPTDQRRYANALRLQRERSIEALANELIDGKIDLSTWQQRMKDELRKANLEQFVTGKGGVRTGLKPGDYGVLGPELRRQYQYLRDFAAVIEKAAEDGKDLNFIVARAKMYARSTQAMYWKSAVPVELPQVPRDGRTRCKTNCKCRLDVDNIRNEQDVLTEVLVYWRLGPAEHCEDCINLARTWNPLRIAVAGDMQESSIEQAVNLLLMAEPELRLVERDIRAMWNIREEKHV